MGAIASAVSTTQNLGTIARVEWVQMMRQQLSAVRLIYEEFAIAKFFDKRLSQLGGVLERVILSNAVYSCKWSIIGVNND